MSDPLDRLGLCRLLEVEESFIIELERHEIVQTREDGTYDTRAIERIRLSCTLKTFGVNLAGLEIALDLLERWHGERRRVHELLEQIQREREE